MATPYFQIRRDEVPSTQDLARAKLEALPVLVVASSQTAGRGRGGSAWTTADRGAAGSLAWHAGNDSRPLSLIAGVAAVRAIGTVDLKWPNDIMSEDCKVGGILVEKTDDVVVAGLGLNLWWPGAPSGVGALYEEDPGGSRHAEVICLWAAEFVALLEEEGWPADEYLSACRTIGRQITWEPRGSGVATGVDMDGRLLVFDGRSEMALSSGAVRHVKS